jgi:hypothetical protein
MKALVIVSLSLLLNPYDLRFGLGQSVFKLVILDSNLRGRFVLRV